MVQQDEPSDYVICTGETQPLSAFVDEVFRAFGLSAKDYVDEDQTLFRPSDIHSSVGSAARARERLGWTAQFHMRDVARAMVSAARGAPPR